MGRHLVDLTGQINGFMKVLYKVGDGKDLGQTLWCCQCLACQNIHVVRYSTFTAKIENRRMPLNCGCLRGALKKIKEMRKSGINISMDILKDLADPAMGDKPKKYRAILASPQQRLYSTYRGRCYRSKREFALSHEQFYALIGDICFYCGKPPSQKIKYGRQEDQREFLYNGIDRVDSSRGYVLNNCVTCCGKCNRMKLDYDQKDFIKHIVRMALHMKKTGLLSEACKPVEKTAVQSSHGQ